MYWCGSAAVPEFVSDEDDPPLQQKGGKHLQEVPDAEALQQAVEVNVLQPGVHWATQSQNLHEQQEHRMSVNAALWHVVVVH